MLTPLCLIVAAFGLVAHGECREKVFPSGLQRTNGPIVVVTASYVGATPETVADVVAAVIEVEVDGVEGMVWMESESGNDGSYIARIWFKPQADPKPAIKLVQDRVALAFAALPEQVQQTGISVKTEAAAAGGSPVAIALTDREDRGREALQQRAAAVLKRLVTDDAAVNPEAFPGPDERQITLRINRARCAEAGVTDAALRETVRAAGPSAKIETLKTLTVASERGDRTPLDWLTGLEEAIGPPAVYRVNGHTSVRITGLPPQGKTATEAAARWVKLAEAERQGGFGVENLTPK
jgi:multidrug efflux pump subunit AcrB